MAKLIEVLNWGIANYQVVITDVAAVAASLAALFMIIPGEQPEKFLHGMADFLGKFSKK